MSSLRELLKILGRDPDVAEYDTQPTVTGHFTGRVVRESQKPVHFNVSGHRLRTHSLSQLTFGSWDGLNGYRCPSPDIRVYNGGGRLAIPLMSPRLEDE